MVDNRYTGVGYEPPFETPSDKDFMAAHIEALEAKLAEAREEIERLKAANDDFRNRLNPSYDYVDGQAVSVAEDEIDRLRGELETERMRLAGCGVVAMANTPESAAATRIPKENPYWSASMGDVESAVDREMAAREEIARLRKALERLSNPLACGCKPCTGDCRSQTALEAELEGRIDFAKAALEASDEI